MREDHDSELESPLSLHPGLFLDIFFDVKESRRLTRALQEHGGKGLDYLIAAPTAELLHIGFTSKQVEHLRSFYREPEKLLKTMETATNAVRNATYSRYEFCLMAHKSVSILSVSLSFVENFVLFFTALHNRGVTIRIVTADPYRNDFLKSRPDAVDRIIKCHAEAKAFAAEVKVLNKPFSKSVIIIDDDDRVLVTNYSFEKTEKKGVVQNNDTVFQTAWKVATKMKTNDDRVLEAFDDDGGDIDVSKVFPGCTYKKPPSGPVDNTVFEREYQEELDQFLQDEPNLPKGMWVAYVTRHMLGPFDDRNTATEAGYKEAIKQGRKAVFVKQVGVDDELPADYILLENIQVSNVNARTFIRQAVVQDRHTAEVDIISPVIIDTGSRAAVICHPNKLPNICSMTHTKEPFILIGLSSTPKVHEATLLITEKYGDIALIGMPIIEQYDLHVPRIDLGQPGHLFRDDELIHAMGL